MCVCVCLDVQRDSIEYFVVKGAVIQIHPAAVLDRSVELNLVLVGVSGVRRGRMGSSVSRLELRGSQSTVALPPAPVAETPATSCWHMASQCADLPIIVRTAGDASASVVLTSALFISDATSKGHLCSCSFGMQLRCSYTLRSPCPSLTAPVGLLLGASATCVFRFCELVLWGCRRTVLGKASRTCCRFNI